MQKTKIYSAKKIYTMNPCRSIVSHVAVKEGKILGAGSLEELASWGEFDLDDTFSEKVIMPGFVEGHAHTMEGTLWRKVYLGWFDRTDPNGKTWRGLKSLNEIIERLSAAEKEMSDDDSPLSGWSVDPIYMNNQRISRQALDQVSQTRPIGVLHASGHILNVNSKGLELAGLLKKGINHPGIPIGNDGYPTGELYGPDAMTPVGIHVGFDRSMTDCDEALSFIFIFSFKHSARNQSGSSSALISLNSETSTPFSSAQHILSHAMSAYTPGYRLPKK